jgi:hypothetical protein
MFDPNSFGDGFDMAMKVLTVAGTCGHKKVTVELDGEQFVIDTHDLDAANLCPGYSHKETFVRAALVRQIQAGKTLSQLAGKGIL